MTLFAPPYHVSVLVNNNWTTTSRRGWGEYMSILIDEYKGGLLVASIGKVGKKLGEDHGMAKKKKIHVWSSEFINQKKGPWYQYLGLLSTTI